MRLIFVIPFCAVVLLLAYQAGRLQGITEASQKQPARGNRRSGKPSARP